MNIKRKPKCVYDLIFQATKECEDKLLHMACPKDSKL